ncbi:MAG: efflux RND transporter periplasmic adaptor subunit, partial [Candidatus Obscuribacterales bacterium]|nr:efflux RND transporter periplasmic adaptor subunit [Candidatus Obscuribacterales bacterium]
MDKIIDETQSRGLMIVSSCILLGVSLTGCVGLPLSGAKTVARLIGKTSNNESRSARDNNFSRQDKPLTSSKLSASSKTLTEFVELNERQELSAEIKTAKIVDHQLTKPLEFCSTVESPSDTTACIYSLVNGVVTRVLVNVGDEVKSGQLVAYVNSPEIADLQASYLHAVAKLNECRAQEKLVQTRVELSKRDETRLSSLVKDGIAAQRDLELASSRLTATQAELVAASSNIEAATAQLRATRARLFSLGLKESAQAVNDVTYELPISSPISGIITQRLVNPGQTVGPASLASGAKSGALATIADLSKVWVMLEVPQSQVDRLKLGANVDFRSEVSPGKHFKGTVTKLGENFDPTTHIVLVRTEIPNQQHILKTGMLVIASVAGPPLGGKIAIPLAAVQQIDGSDYVFIALGQHRYQKRLVQCGERSADEIVINSG